MEGGSKKCGIYFPQEVGEKMKFGNFSVELKKAEKANSFYIIREFEVTNMNTQETRKVT